MSNVVSVPLRDITVSHNPRHPVPNLQAALADEGFEGYTVLDLVHELALSDDPANKAKFVALIDKYESEGHDGLVALAVSRAKEEIEPILLRAFRTKPAGSDVHVRRYGVVVGERRVLAAAYNHCKHGFAPEIGSQVKEMRLEAAFELAVDENAKRRQMSDYEYGVIFHQYRQQENPATGKKWSLKEIGEKFGFDYQFVRGRQALVAYLPDADQRRLIAGGKVNITAAIRKALSLKRGRADESEIRNKKSNRQRALTLHECQQLFDVTRQKQLDASKKESYLQALADVMQVKYTVALSQSNKRIEEAELAAARKVVRQHRKNNAA